MEWYNSPPFIYDENQMNWRINGLCAVLAEAAPAPDLLAAVEVLRQGLDIFGDGDGHDVEFIEGEWIDRLDCPACAWLARVRTFVRSAPASREAGPRDIGVSLRPVWCIDHAESEVFVDGRHIPIDMRSASREAGLDAERLRVAAIELDDAWNDGHDTADGDGYWQAEDWERLGDAIHAIRRLAAAPVTEEKE